MKKRLFKIIAILLSFSLLLQQTGFAQVAAQLDIASHLSVLHSSFVQDKFRPLHLRYLQYLPQDNSFKLFLDKGDIKPNELNGQNWLNEQTKALLKYFLIGLAIPNDSFWVNLRPDSPDNIIDSSLAKTDLGRILLEADLELKKDTAKATSPETPEGKSYWNKLYQKAEELFGSENITIPTLTRPWIVPDEIIIRESADSAYVYKATLKVCLEQDYLKGNATYSFKDPREKQLNEYSSQLIKEEIIPKLTKEINSAKRYAPLRQVYYSLILSQWFKARFRAQAIADSQQSTAKTNPYLSLIDSQNLTGLTSKQAWSKTTYFQAYQKSFKDGEYNIQEPVSTVYGQSIRSFFSGGFAIGQMFPPFAFGEDTSTNPAGTKTTEVLAASTPAVNPNIVISLEVAPTANPGEFLIRQKESGGSTTITVKDEADLQKKVTAIDYAHKKIGRGHYLGKQNPDGIFAKNTNPALAFTPPEIWAKAKALRKAGLSIDEIDRLIRNGVAGVSEAVMFSNGDWLREASAIFKAAQYNAIIANLKADPLKDLISEIQSKDFIFPQIIANQWVIPDSSSEKILNDLVNDFVKLIGVSLPAEKAQEITAKLKDFLKQDLFSGLQDISHFESMLKIYASQVNGLLNDFGVTASYPERIVPVLVRMGMWAKSLGLIDAATIQGIPHAPSELTVGIATKALAGLGDITKIAMIVNGLFEEFDNRGVNLHIKVFVFAEDSAKMGTIEKGLQDKLGKGVRKNGTKGTLEVIPIHGDNATLTIGDPRLNDVSVFVTLVRPVRETLTLPREVSPMARVPRVCITLGEYDSMVSPNPRMRSVSLFEVKTGFADNSIGFFVNPYTEALYQRIHAASQNELASMRSALFEDLVLEIWLESHKRVFLAGALVAPTEEELAQEMDSETTRCRSRLSALQGAIQQANNSSRWAVLYMHHEGIKYLQALQRFRQQSNNQDSVTIFTFFGEKNREADSVNEWEELKKKAASEGLPFEFYDFSADPSLLASADFTKPAVRVINLGMRSLEANIRTMALSDLPVGVTGDESLLTALTLRKPVFYEVMSWKRNLFAALLKRVKEVDNADSGAAAALNNFSEGALGNEVAALFDSHASAVQVFSRLGDLVPG